MFIQIKDLKKNIKTEKYLINCLVFFEKVQSMLQNLKKSPKSQISTTNCKYLKKNYQ